MQPRFRTLMAALVATMFFGALVPAGPALAAGTDGELAAATATVDRFAQAMRGNDAGAIGALLAHDDDTVSFGTDKAERWVGYGAMMASLKAQLAGFQTTSIEVRDQVVHLMPAGDGAYFSEVWDWSINAQGQNMVLKDLRLTGVLVRRDDRWEAVQFHFSLPVGGQAVAY